MKNLLKLLEENALKFSEGKKGCVTIGINGVDCSGKTFLSEKVKEHISEKYSKSSIIHVDDYDFPEVLDSVYGKLENGELTPNDVDSYYDGVIDTKGLLEAITAAKEVSDILILEGIFIFKPYLIEMIDFKIYLEIDKEKAIDRFIKRDEIVSDSVPEATALFNDVWFASHIRYCNEVKPRDIADLVIFNDFLKPTVERYNQNRKWLSESFTSLRNLQPLI